MRLPALVLIFLLWKILRFLYWSAYVIYAFGRHYVLRRLIERSTAIRA